MLAVVLLCIACAAYWWWRLSIVKPTEPPSLPGGWPVVGHSPRLIAKDSRTLWNLINVVAQEISDLGGVATVGFGPKKVYVLTDPEDSVTVLTLCLEKDTYYSFVKPWIGNGLITARYAIWKKHRKLLNPAFSQILLDTFMGIFNSQSRKLVKDLEKEAGEGDFDHWTYTRHNALETICMTAMGVDFTDPNLNSKYVRALDQMLKTLVERFGKLWLHHSKSFAWSKIKKKQDACLKILHNMSNTVLQKRKSQLNQNKSTDNSAVPGSKIKTFIDLLLELSAEKGVLNDKEIRDHVDTILVAGHDTSANVLMFTMILLGSHPDIQEKAFAEIQEVLEEDRDVEKTDLSKLVYLEAVLKESLRLFTIVPFIARRLDKNIQLTIDVRRFMFLGDKGVFVLENCTLSAGKTCILFLFGTHKHPVWGQDVNEFKPERWLAPECPNAFAAFGFGRRCCIGKAYAIMSMKTTLAHVVRSYRIKADLTKLRVKADVMLKPDAGHHISIERRT